MDKIFLLDPRHDQFVVDRSKRLNRWTLSSILNTMLTFLFAYVGPIVTSIVLLIMALTDLYTYMQLNNAGQAIQAPIIGLNIIEKSKTADEHYVTYTFKIGNHDYSKTHRIDDGLYENLKEDVAIEVRYRVDDPEDSFPLSLINNMLRDSLVKFMVSISVFSLALMLISITYNRLKEQRRLVHEGHIIEGEVVTAAGQEDDNGYEVTLKYKYCREDGTEVQKSAAHVRNDLRHKSLPNAGTKLAILYISDNLLEVL